MQEMSPQKQGFEIPMSKNVPYGNSPYEGKREINRIKSKTLHFWNHNEAKIAAVAIVVSAV